MIAIVSNIGLLPSRDGGARLRLRGFASIVVPRTKGECHRPVRDYLVANPRHAFEHAHSAAQASHTGFDDDHVPRMHRAPITDAVDSHEVNQLLTILWLGKNQNG